MEALGHYGDGDGDGVIALLSISFADGLSCTVSSQRPISIQKTRTPLL